MTPEFIRKTLDKLAKNDSDLSSALFQVGYPAPRIRETGFGALIHIIIGQQVSTKSAKAIRERLKSVVNPLTPKNFLAVGDEQIRGVGFSKRKIEYGKGLAEAIIAGMLDIHELEHLDDEKVAKAITKIRGLGQWSADIYMLFSLGRPDVWPHTDLAIKVAVQKLKRMPDRPNRDQMLQIAQRWQPYRGIVALFLWHYYKRMPVGGN